MTDAPVLSVEEARVRRGGAEVLRGVDLTLRAGERVALIGHNGAGKSTLMKAALGLIPLSGGRIRVAGAAPGSAAARAAAAYLPENVAFHPALTGREALSLFARLRRAAPEVPRLLRQVGMEAAADRRIATYSKGQRQRIGLAQALLGRPALAILDEPTSGLDPISRGEFYGHVDAMAAQGTAVLISSHALTELEARTDRIAVLRGGRLVAAGALADLRRAAALPITVQVSAAPEAADRVADALGGTRMNGCAVLLRVRPEEKMALLARIAGMGPAVRDVEIAPPSLEDLYRRWGGAAAPEQPQEDLG